MATFETAAVLAKLRAQARDQHEQLFATCREIILSGEVDLPERLELSTWLAEGRRLLAGDEAPRAGVSAPANVKGFVRLVGPLIKKRDLLLPPDGGVLP